MEADIRDVHATVAIKVTAGKGREALHPGTAYASAPRCQTPSLSRHTWATGPDPFRYSTLPSSPRSIGIV